jgi:DNA polymerase/3'-5' exonuclease PolX
MRFDYQFAIEEYKKVEKYLEKHGYKCQVTGSLRREKKDIGDIDIVVGENQNKKMNIKNFKKIEIEILEIISKYNKIERQINYYEFLLKSGISIHVIPEISKYFNYTLWHSTGPKQHVKLIKKIYQEKGMKIDSENTIESDIYMNIDFKYLEPKKRYKFV